MSREPPALEPTGTSDNMLTKMLSGAARMRESTRLSEPGCTGPTRAWTRDTLALLTVSSNQAAAHSRVQQCV